MSARAELCELGAHELCPGTEDDSMFNERARCRCACHAGPLRRLLWQLVGRGAPHA